MAAARAVVGGAEEPALAALEPVGARAVVAVVAAAASPP